MRILFFILLSSCQVWHPTPKKKVILISIDGLRPEFYQDSKYETKNLKKLATGGVYAPAMESVFPTLTYPNHTTLVTGKSSAEHGIYSNQKFNRESGPTTEWYWYEKDIQTITLWDEVKKNGGTTLGVHWPVSAEAPITYNIPEIFETPPWLIGPSFDLVNQYGTKNLANKINEELGLKPYTNMKEADIWAAKVFPYLFKKHNPDFSALHLIYADKNQHESGRNSKASKNAIEWLDEKLESIIKVVDKKTCLMIVGDHGFMDYSELIHINALFYQQGWIEIDKKTNKLKSYQVIAQKSGGQAAIYLKDKTIQAKVMRVLRQNQNLGYEIVSKKDLNRLKAYPDAIAALSPKDGFSLGGNLTGKISEPLKQVKGQHGHLPSLKKMHTGFIAYNCGLKPMKQAIKNTWIAPAIREYLGYGKKPAIDTGLEFEIKN